MRTSRWFLGCGFTAFAAVSAAQTPAEGLVLTNARVIDGAGRTLERASIVVRDGRIAAVSEGAAPSVPGARVIDATPHHSG
jgi:N-acyl-D-aspartate/D-glutamate deacylase